MINGTKKVYLTGVYNSSQTSGAFNFPSYTLKAYNEQGHFQCVLRDTRQQYLRNLVFSQQTENPVVLQSKSFRFYFFFEDVIC